ncbi:17318_t:CDS:2, partial [Gigaspora rosea]
MHDRIIKFYSIAKKEASLFEPGRYVLMLELADDCWEDDPEKRPTIVQVVNWLEKITLEDTFSNIKRSERLGKYLNDIESFDYLQFSDFRLIARSENARVYSAIFQGKKYAIKCLYNNMKRDDTEFKSFIRELKPLSMIDHPNIVKFYSTSNVCDVLTKLKNISIETSIEFITNNMNNNKSEDQCNMSYTEPQTEHRNLNDDSSDDIAGNSN